MAQVVAELALHVPPRLQRVHLVDAHLVEPVGVRLERVEDGAGLAVGERDDEVGAGRHVVEHGLRWRGGAEQVRSGHGGDCGSGGRGVRIARDERARSPTAARASRARHAGR